MSQYRSALPQVDGGLFLTDGGVETTLVFHEGLDLPEFAAFPLLDEAGGRQILRRCLATYADLARKHGVGLVVETATWRANPDWGAKLGYGPTDLSRVHRLAVDELVELRGEYESDVPAFVISGCLGPRGDGYLAEEIHDVEEAERYHGPQIEAFRDSAADLVTAQTLTHTEEAIGVVRGAMRAGMPVVISFTVETDGRLPSGQGLGEAIETVDAATGTAPLYYMINCAHPTHFDHVLEPGARWLDRIRGLRANASSRSHAELNEATELDEGNPDELGRQYVALRSALSRVNVLGGCCGTDHRHVDAIAQAWLSG